MKRDRIIKLDGHKPLDCMTVQELDEDFMRLYGMTFDEWKAFCDEHKEDSMEEFKNNLNDYISSKT